MNVTSAKDWLVKSWHHYSSAKILFDAHHFTDCIAIDLHYSIEISLKAILAYRNDKIVKSHDLLEIHSLIAEQIDFNDDELALLDIVTRYHVKESYPNPTRILPPRDEIKKVLEFADQLLDRVCTLLNISTHEIKSEPN
ncbi:MAG: HEPN domain-containing protein [Sulfuricurvum sp.]|jgi:HEPN domain-containing protein|uniref:HEPN domain-containing protein n=1 Tax=Sulfuricurvum sp. TaxID=2025608 RepID=UPI0025DDA9BE|nr:HEPN domain-containing protein [Sulfuricurvum sp.]MCK9373299.1 HEPN domain-containing protein [Sulfuricurvum sp.]